MPLLVQMATRFLVNAKRLGAATFFVLFRIIAFVTMGVVLVVTAGIVWFFWHPRVVIPLQGTNLSLVYQHNVRLRSSSERLELVESSFFTSTSLAEAVSRVYKSPSVGGQLWRSPDNSAYYVQLQEGLFRADLANRTLERSLYPEDDCPSDGTTKKWPMKAVDPKRFPNRPPNFIFVGAIRGDSFTPADQLQPPAPPHRRRNCAAEALVWDGYAFTAIEGTEITAALRLRWLPGDAIFYEFKFTPWWGDIFPSNIIPPPLTVAIPPRIRFSLYRDGDVIFILEDSETSSLWSLDLRTGTGQPLAQWQRPACRVGDAPASSEQPPNAPDRPSGVFEHLRWLGRFEARLEPLPGGRWDGKLLFLSAAAASEDILAPERFCDPTARLRSQQR
jgi:hypothetical protein